jgi:hypothetical protein
VVVVVSLYVLLARSKDADARQRRQVYAVCASLTALPGTTVALKRNSGSWAFTTRIVLHAQGIFLLDSETGESWVHRMRTEGLCDRCKRGSRLLPRIETTFSARSAHVPLMPAQAGIQNDTL